MTVVDSYISFVRNHALLVRPLEGLIRTVTFFLPSRFYENGNGEIVSEGALAASNVMTLVNDLVLLGPRNTPLLPKEEDRLGLTLLLISHTEVLAEKISMRLGDGTDHLVVLWLEALKVLLRLRLVSLQQQHRGNANVVLLDGGRAIPTFHRPVESSSSMPGETYSLGVKYSGAISGVEEDQEDEEVLLRVLPEEVARPKRADCREGQEWKRGRRTGRKFRYFSESYNGEDDYGSTRHLVGDLTRCHARRTLSSPSPSWASSSTKSGASTSPSAPTTGDCEGVAVGIEWTREERPEVAQARARLLLAGEILHILRPLVLASLRWALARRRRVKGRAVVAPPTGRSLRRGPLHSAAPEWLLVLLPALMDLVSYQCTTGALNGDNALKQSCEDELRRRKNLWFLYLLRTPVFEGLTHPVTRAVDGNLVRLPLVGGLASYGYQALVYIQRHFTLTSGS
ncbi:hypothetical protein NSK_000137 [Nannochloropsis salina CCMP1776]|jgi:hypothetical protein|uniref:Peroxisomal membrane protein PEX16 n=1 Tax=Nannochloropsis salina CCMP1776 TaxID=1027361 RepID=A0A4D9DEI4_9STRA|nr:hypothetical protein NSK_000137 [Nannochloropsis salina CCMP1776]|eukprot:TFJ88563.1 hypothetical protein NSK_000137 [Nannochloropsis salina CCMP1776]